MNEPQKAAIKTYSHAIIEEAKVDKSFEPSMLKKLFFNPFYFELIFYKLYLYYKPDGQGKYAENEALREGEKIYTCIPSIEGTDKSLWRIVKLIDNLQYLSMTMELIEPSAKSTLRDASITISYQDGTVKVHLQTNPKHPAMLEIPRMVFKQVAHRMSNLMADFNRCYQEFMIAGAVDMQRSDKADFYGNPYEIRTSLIISGDLPSVNQSFRTHAFIHKILHPTDSQYKEQNNIQLHKVLEEGNKFDIKLNNMKFQMFPAKFEPIQEAVIFEVKKCQDNRIELLSNSGIYNFYQYGMRFEIKTAPENKTIVDVSVYYNLSSLLSVANKGANALKALPAFFQPAKVPDPTLILYLRMRSMLDATIRHLCRHVTETLKVDIAPSIEKPTLESSLQKP